MFVKKTEKYLETPPSFPHWSFCFDAGFFLTVLFPCMLTSGIFDKPVRANTLGHTKFLKSEPPY